MSSKPADPKSDSELRDAYRQAAAHGRSRVAPDGPGEDVFRGFIGDLARAVTAGKARNRVRLVLLDYDHALPTAVRHHTEEECIEPVTETHVREFFDGLLCLAGSISNGAAIRDRVATHVVLLQ